MRSNCKYVDRISAEDIKNGNIVEFADGSRMIKIRNQYWKITLDCMNPSSVIDEEQIDCVFNETNGKMLYKKGIALSKIGDEDV